MPEGFSLRQAELQGLRLRNAVLFGFDFEEADLTRAEIRNCDLSGSSFRRAIFRSADILGSIIADADFSGACLDGATFRDSNLKRSKFGNASTRGTKFPGTDTSGSDLGVYSGVSTLRGRRGLQSPAPNPFSPGSGRTPKWFGGRAEVQDRLREALVEVSNGRFDHVVLLGGPGMGKTTQLLWFRDVVQFQNMWASYVPFGRRVSETSTKEAVLELVQKIHIGLPEQTGRLKELAATITEGAVSVAGFGVALKRDKETQPERDTLLMSYLHGLYQRIGGRAKCIALLLDNVDELRPGPEVLSTIANSLLNLTNVFQMKFLAVMSSDPRKWDQLT
ncbi:MAG: pentapeptide repeat-containing protein, partial [Candidatus Latescibacterota bacterium]